MYQIKIKFTSNRKLEATLSWHSMENGILFMRATDGTRYSVPVANNIEYIEFSPELDKLLSTSKEGDK